jgi:hypothetical protein
LISKNTGLVRVLISLEVYGNFRGGVFSWIHWRVPEIFGILKGCFNCRVVSIKEY